METKQILIEIRVKLQQQALQALSRNLAQMPKALNNLRTGFWNITGGIMGAFRQLTLWDSLFGRVTQAMLVWAGWRMVWRGFGAIADAIVGGNERMQTAMETFTALSGGSREMAQTYIDILRRLSLETGANFGELLENAKRLPTQVGQNFEAFTNLTKKAIVLGMLDPVQGIQGAFLALTNAMEGNAAGFRSLMMRFELGNKELIKRILDETANPLEALDKIFQELNIDVDVMTDRLKGTLPVIRQGLTNTWQNFARVLGEPVINKITYDLGRLRDALLQNQPAIEGFAVALGEGIARAYEKAKAFINQLIFGGAGLNAGSWYQAGMNLMLELSRGMFDALTGYVLPTVTAITEAIASFLIGASPPPVGPLSQIREGGEETVKQYVLGMINGLKATDIAAIAQEIMQNVIGLEAQELAQEKSIKALEDWVQQASDAVQAARDRIELFDLRTADIPERYTRGRRRELELQVMAAEKEERSRRKQLELAREQLQATKEYLQVQKRILSLLEQQQKASEKVEQAGEEAAQELDRSFKPSPFNVEEMKKQVADYAQKFREQLKPIKEEWKKGFADLADFVRGLAGKAPGDLGTVLLGVPPSEMWQLGAGLSTAVTKIAQSVTTAISGLKETLSAVKDTWGQFPEPLRMLILTAFGLMVAPKAVAIVAMVNLLGAKISDLKGLLEFLGSLAAFAAAGLLIVGPPGTLLATLTILVRLLLDKENQQELLRWIDPGLQGRLYQIHVIIEWYLREPIEQWLNKNVATPFKNWWNSWAPDWLKIDEKFALDLTPELDKLSGQAGAEQTGAFMDGVVNLFKRRRGKLDETVHQNVYLPIITRFKDIEEEVVGQSIVPDMLARIVSLFMRLPFWLKTPLLALQTTMLAAITSIRTAWLANLSAMVQATITSVNAMNAVLMASNQQAGGAAGNIELPDISQMLPTLPWFSPSAYSPAAAAAIAQAPASAIPSSLMANITMDAKQTQKFMEEGVYQGILELTRATA